MNNNFIVLDIESEAIVPGAPLLPRPVGVAIKEIRWMDSAKVPYFFDSEYMAFGHPTENTTDFETVRKTLKMFWNSDLHIITHNGATFDIPVLEHWFNLPKIDPLRVHDTLFLAYLNNPHARSLSLKDLAQDLLGVQPAERDELYDWIMANVPECRSRKQCGAHISKAPGDLVGRYAAADVEMTWKLFEHLHPLVVPRMQEPYERELKLAPILVDIQNRGVRVDVEQLGKDTVASLAELEALDADIRTRLKSPELSIDSNDSLVEALQLNGYTGFSLTEKGKLSTNKASMQNVLAADPELKQVLERRSALATLTSTFMVPWLELCTANGGRLHAAYNQVRNPDGFGTRTGRLSSTNPNLQNVAKELIHGLPMMRSFLLPEEGCVWVTADFKSQEPRIAAHFEDGALLRAFQDTPEIDQYLWIAEVSGGITRKQAKVVFLGLLYGMGKDKLASQLGVTPDQAQAIKDKVRAALPDVVALDAGCKRRFRMGDAIRTLGGRYYHCEPPSKGKTWEYKALNTLIQGSAADQTKEALIYVAARLQEGERILGTVHDEISVSCTQDRVEAVKQILREAASALPCDVPMLMDFGTGTTWAEAK